MVDIPSPITKEVSQCPNTYQQLNVNTNLVFHDMLYKNIQIHSDLYEN